MKVIEHDGYKELQVTFEELINLIRPDDTSELKKYFEGPNSKFIFRGQSDSIYDLTPSIFREDITYSSIGNNYLGLCYRQYAFLRSFVHGCDLNAVPIPYDSHDFREKYFGDNTNCYHPNIWPDKGLYELIGLAQHYGYPTEFLDWSYNPPVACYFASSGVVKKDEQIKDEDSMSVWVFDAGQIFRLNPSTRINVELVNIPRSLNENISAQEGCFTLVRQNLLNRENFVYKDRKIQGIRSLPEVMYEYKQSGLLKITIKRIEAAKILDYCNSYRINAATLFRGYKGAVEYAIDGKNRNRFIVKNNLKSHGIPI